MANLSELSKLVALSDEIFNSKDVQHLDELNKDPSIHREDRIGSTASSSNNSLSEVDAPEEIVVPETFSSNAFIAVSENEVVDGNFFEGTETATGPIYPNMTSVVRDGTEEFLTPSNHENHQQRVNNPNFIITNIGQQQLPNHHNHQEINNEQTTNQNFIQLSNAYEEVRTSSSSNSSDSMIANPYQTFQQPSQSNFNPDFSVESYGTTYRTNYNFDFKTEPQEEKPNFAYTTIQVPEPTLNGLHHGYFISPQKPEFIPSVGTVQRGYDANNNDQKPTLNGLHHGVFVSPQKTEFIPSVGTVQRSLDGNNNQNTACMPIIEVTIPEITTNAPKRKSSGSEKDPKRQVHKFSAGRPRDDPNRIVGKWIPQPPEYRPIKARRAYKDLAVANEKKVNKVLKKFSGVHQDRWPRHPVFIKDQAEAISMLEDKTPQLKGNLVHRSKLKLDFGERTNVESLIFVREFVSGLDATPSKSRVWMPCVDDQDYLIRRELFEEFLAYGELFAVGKGYDDPARREAKREELLQLRKESGNQIGRMKKTYVEDKKNMGKRDWFFLCIFCAETFQDKGKLGLHLRSHMEIREYRCYWCPYSAVQNNGLHRHYANVHGLDENFAAELITARHQKLGEEERALGFLKNQRGIACIPKGHLREHLKNNNFSSVTEMNELRNIKTRKATVAALLESSKQQKGLGPVVAMTNQAAGNSAFHGNPWAKQGGIVVSGPNACGSYVEIRSGEMNSKLDDSTFDIFDDLKVQPSSNDQNFMLPEPSKLIVTQSDQYQKFPTAGGTAVLYPEAQNASPVVASMPSLGTPPGNSMVEIIHGHQMNGPQKNGSQINGPQMNGSQINGHQAIGLEANGPQINVSQINAPQIYGHQTDVPNPGSIKADGIVLPSQINLPQPLDVPSKPDQNFGGDQQNPGEIGKKNSGDEDTDFLLSDVIVTTPVKVEPASAGSLNTPMTSSTALLVSPKEPLASPLPSGTPGVDIVALEPVKDHQNDLKASTAEAVRRNIQF